MRFFNKQSLILSARSFAVILVFALVATIGLVVWNGRDAQAATPFGGRVTTVVFCTCSLNFLLTVSPPVGGMFIYEPFSTVVYEFHRIPVVGVWLLGLRSSATSCTVFVGKGCASLGSYPVIQMTGTSM